MIRVLVADDHAVVRRGLKHIIAEAEGLSVTAEAVNGPDAIQAVEEQRCDVLVLDVSLPGCSGLEVLSEVKRRRPGIPVLILSVHPEEQYALRCLRAGAAGYLTKEAAPTELVEAVRAVARGERYITPRVAGELADNLVAGDLRQPHERLSDRELEVLRRIADGQSPTEIAQRLHLSVKTVATYKARVLVKLGMRDTAGIIRYAIEHDLTR